MSGIRYSPGRADNNPIGNPIGLPIGGIRGASDAGAAPTDYVAYYKFEDLNGTDETGSYNFITITGGVTNLPMAVGNGVSIPLADYMETTSNPLSSGDLSISFFHQSNRNSIANERLLSDTNAPAAHSGAMGLIQTSTNKMQVRRGNSIDASDVYFTGLTSINDNVLRHVAIVCSGTTCTLYLNKVQDGTGTGATAIVAGPAMAVGATPLPSGNGDLDMDEMKIFPRAIATDEIAALAAEGGL